jgi:serine/threonine protein kinase
MGNLLGKTNPSMLERPSGSERELRKNKIKSKIDEKKEKGKDVKDVEEKPEVVIRDVSKMKAGIKGGSSAYGKVFPRKPKSKVESVKSSSSSHNHHSDHNIQQTREFQEVAKMLGDSKRDTVLKGIIGSGAYANVYKAYNKRKKRLVAVKVIDLTKCKESYQINFLPRELELLQRLYHKNIVKVLEIIQTSRRVVTIMEYCENGTVADFIKTNGAIDESISRAMFILILEAVNYMHAQNVAHRDLKVENILLDKYYVPKLSDFSLSKESNFDKNQGLSSTFCGSIPYFPPEILLRKPYNPLIADMWSLGICLYVMLNDGLPFPLNDERQMLKNQLRKKWDFKSRVKDKRSKQAKQCVAKMLEPNTCLRVTSTGLMMDSWVRRNRNGPESKSEK